METVVVTPSGDKSRAYSVMIGAGLVERADEYLGTLQIKKAFIIADKRLSKAKQALTQALTRGGCEVASVSIPVSESAKEYRKIFPLYTRMIEARMDRQSVIFALGGGVIGDLSGFIAGTYLRGIRWVGVPSTLLAQVDSSIGGKTGVNHPQGKNLIGCFHQPSAVICDTDLLKTLSKRDRVSGFAEMLKCALTFDAAQFDFLVNRYREILALDSSALPRAVEQTVRWKADVIQRDEFERSGLRQVLNFGHTLGHAIESATKYKRFRHGEAVLWGIRWETALSVVRGKLSAHDQKTIDQFLKTLSVPTLPATCTAKNISELIKTDKKVKDGKVHFVLLKAMGKTIVDSEVTPQAIAEAFTMIKAGK